jgi:hypothetical protein
MARLILASWLSLFLFAVPTFAADAADTTSDPTIAARMGSTTTLTTALATMTATPVGPMATAAGAVGPTDWSRSRRPSILPALYVGSALLQGYDAYSTMTALSRGATEANPMMKTVTGNPMLFIGVKAAVAATSIMAAEKMWKNHNRVGAIIVMAASNGLMAIVAAHNASVIRGLP